VITIAGNMTGNFNVSLSWETSNITPSPLNATNPGALQPGQFQYYSLSGVGADIGSMVFSLEASQDGASFFAQPNALPTFAAAPVPVQSVTFDNCSQNPAAYCLEQPFASNVTTWYFLVYNGGSNNITFNLTFASQSCTPPMQGNACAFNTSSFGIGGLDGVNLSGTVPASGDVTATATSEAGVPGFAYYTLDTSMLNGATGFIRVTVAENSGMIPSVYARQNAIPTVSSYDLVVGQGNDPTPGAIQLSLNTSASAPIWYVGVFSNNVPYSIWFGGNCANNCSTLGTCECQDNSCTAGSVFAQPIATLTDDSFGKCNCLQQTGFDCAIPTPTPVPAPPPHTPSASPTPAPPPDKSFQTIYIVLIAVGGAIILAVAIGVPVYCYVQNRKRARYERV